MWPWSWGGVSGEGGRAAAALKFEQLSRAPGAVRGAETQNNNNNEEKKVRRQLRATGFLEVWSCRERLKSHSSSTQLTPPTPPPPLLILNNKTRLGWFRGEAKFCAKLGSNRFKGFLFLPLCLSCNSRNNLTSSSSVGASVRKRLGLRVNICVEAPTQGMVHHGAQGLGAP